MVSLLLYDKIVAVEIHQLSELLDASNCLQQLLLKIQDPISRLGSATGKGFDTHFCLLQQQDPKENPFCK